jgi:hypothetical protein
MLHLSRNLLPFTERIVHNRNVFVLARAIIPSTQSEHSKAEGTMSASTAAMGVKRTYSGHYRNVESDPITDIGVHNLPHCKTHQGNMNDGHACRMKLDARSSSVLTIPSRCRIK